MDEWKWKWMHKWTTKTKLISEWMKLNNYIKLRTRWMKLNNYIKLGTGWMKSNAEIEQINENEWKWMHKWTKWMDGMREWMDGWVGGWVDGWNRSRAQGRRILLWRVSNDLAQSASATLHHSKVCFLLTSVDSDPNFFLEKIIGVWDFLGPWGPGAPLKRAGLFIVSAFEPIGRYL
jgi:hypothetical protein